MEISSFVIFAKIEAQDNAWSSTFWVEINSATNEIAIPIPRNTDHSRNTEYSRNTDYPSITEHPRNTDRPRNTDTRNTVHPENTNHI